MSEPVSKKSPPASLDIEARVVDVVFGRVSNGAPRAALFAVFAAVAIHGMLWLWARSSEPSLESWSAELAARVHAELGRQEVVELAKPPPPKEAPNPEEERPPVPVRERVPEAARTTKAPPPPAQAGQIVAQEPRADDPLDLTSDTFVTGTANAYAGGTTTATGTNPVAVLTRTVDPSASPTRAPGQPDRSGPVRLEEDEWQCAWPREADTEQIDERAVVLRIIVGVDGTAESASLMSDPGHGFGQAAVACALRTRFTPARDRQGRTIKSQSPPIRVRFTR